VAGAVADPGLGFARGEVEGDEGSTEAVRAEPATLGAVLEELAAFDLRVLEVVTDAQP